MNEIPIDIFKCTFNYRLETGAWTWELVTNTKEAESIDPDYQLASINDLHDYAAACGYIFEGIVRVFEGEFKWVELTTEEGEDFCEYVSTSFINISADKYI